MGIVSTSGSQVNFAIKFSSTRPEELPLDFNYAYNPSCAYNDQWVCPLSPAENTLRLSIEAGEKDFSLV
jgi:uncharacterized protein (DUF1684 family)